MALQLLKNSFIFMLAWKPSITGILQSMTIRHISFFLSMQSFCTNWRASIPLKAAQTIDSKMGWICSAMMTFMRSSSTTEFSCQGGFSCRDRPLIFSLIEPFLGRREMVMRIGGSIRLLFSSAKLYSPRGSPARMLRRTKTGFHYRNHCWPATLHRILGSEVCLAYGWP